MPSQIPFPPLELRKIVGPIEDAAYDNPSGSYVWGPLSFTGKEPDVLYDSIFDFGCGCGRNARQLLLQKKLPRKYLGIDISSQLIRWCQDNLTPLNPNFVFKHHGVFNLTYAPDNPRRTTDALPAPDGSYSLFNAHSVFTHLYFEQSKHYLGEACRILKEDGVIRSTWFFIDTRVFPVLDRSHQFCIYVNEIDPTQAVYYDIHKALDLFDSLDLSVLHVEWTGKYGFQTEVYMGKTHAYPDKSRSLLIPKTVVGSDADPSLLVST